MADRITDPKTQGLPAVNTASTRRDGQHYFLAMGIEALTSDLHQGRAINPETIRAAELLIQRVGAMERALQMRFEMQVTNDEIIE